METKCAHAYDLRTREVRECRFTTCSTSECPAEFHTNLGNSMRHCLQNTIVAGHAPLIPTSRMQKDLSEYDFKDSQGKIKALYLKTKQKPQVGRKQVSISTYRTAHV